MADSQTPTLLPSSTFSTPTVHHIRESRNPGHFKMKAATAILSILSLLPAALAADTCVAECGCAGCGQVASASFVQSGDAQVASAKGWATMSVEDDIISLENESGSTLTAVIYGVVCYYISPHSSCTVTAPDNFRTTLGLQVWQHP
ncbi:hypothetical protein F4680DRAFT_403090 [Xylaria scruposa]|nr:hypothetical protein F4680DRAFT_403090 [Xylaria scruposa]